MTEPTTGVTTAGAGQTTTGQAVSQPQSQPQGSQSQGMPQTPQATTPVTTETVTTQTPEGEVRTVPVHVLKTVETKYKDTLSENQNLKNQLAQAQIMQRMAPQLAQTPVQPAQPATQQDIDVFNGMSDADLLSVADMRKIVQTLKPQTPDLGQVLKPVNDQIARMEVRMQDPQYENTIKTYLPEMITAQPFLMEMISRSPNPLNAALTVAKMSPKYVQNQQPVTQPEQTQEDPLTLLSKIITNATMPAAPASQGGTGAVSGFDRFKQMNDVDFDKEVRRVLGR